jgi:hypothetical protein
MDSPRNRGKVRLLTCYQNQSRSRIHKRECLDPQHENEAMGIEEHTGGDKELK